jgi:hypothetical protein
MAPKIEKLTRFGRLIVVKKKFPAPEAIYSCGL